MTHLSLFTGIGGIDLAAEWAGFETVAMVERDKFCQQVLAKRFPNVPIYDDVTTFDGYKYEKEIDLLSAGFPCQPHSLAGKRKASGDERDLWGEVVRILGETKPRFFLGENVPGLLTSESGRFFGRILNDLESLGYCVGWATYGAKDIGAVHRRNRVFIIAYSNVLRCNGSSYQSSVSPLSESKDDNCSRVVAHPNLFGTQIPSKGAISTKQVLRSESKEGGLRGNEYVGYSNCKPELQSSSTSIPIRSERDSREDVSGRYWQPIRGGDWREWGISPTVRLESRVCGSNDGVPNRVDRLKALGNAVVPQQVYPILVEIARHLQTFDNQA
jgi:DNA (cytosine-5)-methyltransferase 1